jgi:hypothetical protein
LAKRQQNFIGMPNIQLVSGRESGPQIPPEICNNYLNHNTIFGIADTFSRWPAGMANANFVSVLNKRCGPRLFKLGIWKSGQGLDKPASAKWEE